MPKLIKELIALTCCNMMLFAFVAQCICINTDYAFASTLFAILVSASLSYYFSKNIKTEVGSVITHYERAQFEGIVGNADDHQYDETLEPCVEDLGEIIRPFLASDEAALAFKKEIKENLEPFCTNEWKRPLGKIEKKYYCVIYSNTERILVEEAAYFGNGHWHVFNAKTLPDAPITVLAFSELRSEYKDSPFSESEEEDV